MTITNEMAEKLRTPFPPDEVHHRKGEGGMTFAYINARQVQARLDEAVGPNNWDTAYRVIDPERWAVECQLTIYGVIRADVGYPNSDGAAHEREPLKAAYSDAFKRAAVCFGIGRHLYAKAGPSETPGAARASFIPATEAQVKAIYAIARGTHGMGKTETDELCSEMFWDSLPDDLNRQQASEFIEHLKSKPSAAAAPSTTPSSPLANHAQTLGAVVVAQRPASTWVDDHFRERLAEPVPGPNSSSAPTPNTGRNATSKQVGAIKVIARTKGITEEQMSAHLLDEYYTAILEDLSIKQASEVIDWLQGQGE